MEFEGFREEEVCLRGCIALWVADWSTEGGRGRECRETGEALLYLYRGGVWQCVVEREAGDDVWMVGVHEPDWTEEQARAWARSEAAKWWALEQVVRENE